MHYSVKEIKRIIAESSNEFKPVLGPNVEKDNNKNSREFYTDTEKEVKKFDGGLKEPKKRELGKKEDANKTTLDYNPLIPTSEKQKKNIKAQVNGYTSDLEAHNGIEKAGAEFGKDELFNYFNDCGKEMDKNNAEDKHAGLKARMKDKKIFDVNRLAEGCTKRLKFKHTKFVNESQVLLRVPEAFKKDGERIIMEDKAGNEYVVECEFSPRSGLIETSVICYNNENILNEQVSRIHDLMKYSEKTNSSFSNKQKMNEDQQFNNIFKLTRAK